MSKYGNEKTANYLNVLDIVQFWASFEFWMRDQTTLHTTRCPVLNVCFRAKPDEPAVATDPVLNTLANKYNKTPLQVCTLLPVVSLMPKLV